MVKINRFLAENYICGKNHEIIGAGGNLAERREKFRKPENPEKSKNPRTRKPGKIKNPS